MQVTKRNGSLQPVSFDKITRRISYLANGLGGVNIIELCKEVIANVEDKIKTSVLDAQAAERCSSKVALHIDYGTLAARILINNHHKDNLLSFEKTTEKLFANKALSEKYIKRVREIGYDFVAGIIDYARDYIFDYFGYSTLLNSYLLKVNDEAIETAQDLLMRVCIELSLCDDIDLARESIKENYDLMSSGYFTHATPTLFNSGLEYNQLASCFLFGVDDDSESIMDFMKDAGLTSRHGGGIGVYFSNIRSRGMPIRGVGGHSKGVVHFERYLEWTMVTFDQGAGRRKGSASVYLEMHHPDIVEHVCLRRQRPDKENIEHVFPAVLIPDLFMKRLRDKNSVWSLFDPTIVPQLNGSFGEEYEKIYLAAEEQKKYKSQIPTRELWKIICDSEALSGTPYIIYKDHVNRRNNQSNVGMIKTSNLCTEIMEYASSDHYATCNLASICLPRFVIDMAGESDIIPKQPLFDWEEFEHVVRRIVRNLNNVIDISWYLSDKTRRPNLSLRPIGIGVQGLTDVFFKFQVPFESDEARAINREIFEKLYYFALSESCELAKIRGPYSMFEGSPLSQGKFQFDLCDDEIQLTMEWDALRKEIMQHGVINSLLIAQMPTASTSQIMGNTESVDALTSNIYRRETLAGEFFVCNKYLMHILTSTNQWNLETLNILESNNGSVQSVPTISEKIKSIFKTTWEISQKAVIDLAADRGHFIDQSQSLNIHMKDISLSKYSSMMMYGWQRGLKTGSYYMRTTPPEYAKKNLTVSGKVVCDGSACVMCDS